MILILDANVLLWWWADDASLGDEARGSIADPGNDVVISAATVWEIAVKRAAGRLAAPEDILETIEAEHFELIPITGSDAVAAAALPMHHRDPFDRMVVAQAARIDAVVLTRDRQFAMYGARVLQA